MRLISIGRLALAAGMLVTSKAEGQFAVRSRLSWRTVETPHFAFHYPAELEQWTLNLAAHAEAIDSIVAREIGYAPHTRTHVVVDDPYQQPNGSAWPFLDRPVINLWAAPPTPRDDIGEYEQWGTMLLSHEFAHVAHLTRPSRNPMLRRLWSLSPVDLGPIPLAAPRWVIEGYATYIEGRATGSGRPHGTWRAATLRQWAIEGALPKYEQLDAWGAYEGGEFAYLAGSAYLEWLVAKQGDSSLVHLWRRLSARQTRPFDEAFAGVFGESPRVLYGRFSAELTANAIAFERAGADADSGDVLQHLTWNTGSPAISADGRRAAIVLHSPIAPSRVAIWSTAPEPDTGKAKRDSTLHERDPEDVPARAIYPPPKRLLASLSSKGGAPYEDPRFFRDGRILLWRYEPRGDGTLVADLSIWNPRAHAVQRVTRDASVRDGDPSPDGKTAIATRCRGGWCDLVSVDLTTGAVAALSRGSDEHSYYRPRLSPNGQRLAVAVHNPRGWHTRLFSIDGHDLGELPASSDANEYGAAWIGTDTVVQVSERGGVANLERVAIATGARVRITSVTGAAAAPEPNPSDGSIWFLSLHARGYDLRRIANHFDGARIVAPTDSLFGPSHSLPDRSPAALAVTNEVSSPRSYGLAPRTLRWIPQPYVDADGWGAALTVISSDLIGRSELFANALVGTRAEWRGGTLGLTWRGFAPNLRAKLFAVEQRPSTGPYGSNAFLDADTRLVGGDLALEEVRQYDTWATRLRTGGQIAQLRSVSMTPTPTGTRSLLFADGGLAWAQRGTSSTAGESIALNLSGGQTFTQRFLRGVATINASVGQIGAPALSATATYGRIDQSAPSFERFSLGGGVSPLLDRATLVQRISMPALPTGTATGTSVFVYRAALATRPIEWYFWSGSMSDFDSRFTHWNRVVGAQWSQSVPPIPMAGTPAARAQIGVGESLDAPWRKRLRAYVSVVLNP